MRICQRLVISLFSLLLLLASFLFNVEQTKAEDVIFFDNFLTSVSSSCCFGSDAVYRQEFTVAEGVSNISKIDIAGQLESNVYIELYDETADLSLWTSDLFDITVNYQIYSFEFEAIELDNSHTYSIRAKLGNNPPFTTAGDTNAQGYYRQSDNKNLTNDLGWYMPIKLYYDDEFGKPVILLWGYPNPIQNPSTFEYNETKVFPIFFNTCDQYADFDRAIVIPRYTSENYSPPMTIIESKQETIGPQLCKDTIYYYDTTNEEDTGQVAFDLILYDENDNSISTSTSNTLQFTTTIEEENYITSLEPDPLNIDLGNLPQGQNTATSTTLGFYYDFTTRNVASTTVYLINYRTNSIVASSTGPFTQGRGADFITIDTPTVNTHNIYKYIVSSDGQDEIQSKRFNVIWEYIPYTEEELEENMKLLCEQMPLWDFTGVCDGIDTSGTLGQFNCAIREGLTGVTRLFFRPSCSSLLYFQDNFVEMKKTFPFNVYFDLTDSINTSIDTALVSTSTAGSIDVPFIRQTATSSEFYMLPIASSTSFTNFIGEDNYNLYRQTLGFIWWLIIAIIIYITVRKL